MVGFIKAYLYALEMIKNLKISKATQDFLVDDYNNRLIMENELLKKTTKVEDRKMQNLCKKLDEYIKREIVKKDSTKEKREEER